MPHQIIRAWLSLIVPTAVLLVTIGLFLYASAKVGRASAWLALRPIFFFVILTCVIQTGFFVFRCAPYYLHGTVWSGRTLKKIGLFGMGTMVVMLVWILASFNKWLNVAKKIEAEAKLNKG